MNWIKTEARNNCVICGALGIEAFPDLSDHNIETQIKDKFSLWECARCELLWLNPRPEVDEIKKCYQGFYAESQINPEFLGNNQGLLSKVKRTLRESIICGHYGYKHIHKNHLICKIGNVLAKIPILRSRGVDYLNAFLPFYNHNPNAFLVDVGCGSGDYLAIMQKLGWKVLGIEPDSLAANLARGRGINVFEGKFENAGLSDCQADMITLYHVIEHLIDPLSVIKECLRILKPGGKLVIRAPNIKSLGYRIFGRNWFGLDIPRHLFQFSPKSLRLILNKMPVKDFRIKTLSYHSRFWYDVSLNICRENWYRRGIKPQNGRYWFALKEFMLCYLGREQGEELEVSVTK